MRLPCSGQFTRDLFPAIIIRIMMVFPPCFQEFQRRYDHALARPVIKLDHE